MNPRRFSSITTKYTQKRGSVSNSLIKSSLLSTETQTTQSPPNESTQTKTEKASKMFFQKSALSLLYATAAMSLLPEEAAGAGSNLRNKSRRLKKSTKCTIAVAVELRLDPTVDPGEQFECEFDEINSPNGVGGQIYPIKGNPSQMAEFKKMFNNGLIKPGASELEVGEMEAMYDGTAVILNPNANVPDHVTLPEQAGRRLAVTKGEKPILFVRVTDVNGLVYPHSAAVMGDNVFGTLGDPVNLKSQLFDCSHGQLEVIPGDAYGKETVPGVLDVTIDLDITNSANDRYIIHNAASAAAVAKLGFSLPGPYQQVMFSVEKCYTGCGWAAYAYINSWMSVYQAQYYFMTGVQVHELGHNFNLAHSGGLDGATYTDHTCMMGNPLYSDDVGKMCYNPAKNYQLNWYDSAKSNFKVYDGQSISQELVGIADYLNNPNGLPVTLRLQIGDTNPPSGAYFVGFNRATGANEQNDEADNEVTIITVTSGVGTQYSQSFLKAHLVQGESYTITNFYNSGKDLVVTANTIDLDANPAVATVSLQLGDVTPTDPPTTAPPTNPPTAPPTAPPTDPPPTNPPTRAPTAAPTTAPPTNAPTAAPPTNPPTAAPTQSCSTMDDATCRSSAWCTLSGGKTKTCNSVDGGGGETTPPPTASPGDGGGGGTDCGAFNWKSCPTDGGECSLSGKSCVSSTSGMVLDGCSSISDLQTCLDSGCSWNNGQKYCF